MERGGLSGAVFNAAKERALDRFIAGHMGFTAMAEVIEQVLDETEQAGDRIDRETTLDNVMDADHLTRELTDRVIARRTG